MFIGVWGLGCLRVYWGCLYEYNLLGSEGQGFLIGFLNLGVMVIQFRSLPERALDGTGFAKSSMTSELSALSPKP